MQTFKEFFQGAVPPPVDKHRIEDIIDGLKNQLPGWDARSSHVRALDHNFEWKFTHPSGRFLNICCADKYNDNPVIPLFAELGPRPAEINDIPYNARDIVWRFTPRSSPDEEFISKVRSIVG